MACTNIFRFILTNNLYQVDTKLDAWVKNATKNPNIEIEIIDEFYALVDGRLVWIANDWFGFSVYSANYRPTDTIGSKKFPGWYNTIESKYKFRPSFWVALRLWWKVKKHINTKI